jgi:DEAD/DEAH box helicase domain-containing protein
MSESDVDLAGDETLGDLIEGLVRIDPSEGELLDFGPRMPPEVALALEEAGITSLYGHQREAFDLAQSGENVVIATPAASGKSLCYLLPLLATLRERPDATAILLFPTKALSRDQEQSIARLLRASGIDRRVVTYDGDTPGSRRRQARQSASVLITNPDMLHAAILPRHTAWAGLFSSIRQVVIDEIHQYRGVFGSHVANVFRRLGRVFDFYGARPVWIAASATVGNPMEIAGALTGKPFRLVDRASAPSPGRVLYIASAPLVDPQSGIRRSYLKVAAAVALHLVKAGLQTIVFGNSRNAVEMLLRFLREELSASGMDPQAAQGYRGGYLPGLRREIEGELKRGGLRCVVATSALELGIDVGQLDAVVMAGYPGTIAGLWQRVGRVGRRRRAGVAVLVAGGSPLDQFLVRHPSYITGSSPESCHINPDNIEIVVPHLRCAVSEIPFRAGDRYGRMEADELAQVMDFLAREGETSFSGGTYRWIAAGAPARELSLRTAGSSRLLVVDASGGGVIEEIELARAVRTLHPKAIVQHAGAQYEVREIDFEGGTVTVGEVSCDYYTEPIVEEKLDVIDEHDSEKIGRGEVCLGEIRITQKVIGYKCIRYATNEVLSAHEADLPRQEMEASSLWLKVSGAIFGSTWSLEEVLDEKIDEDLRGMILKKHPVSIMMDGLRGLGTLMTNIAALRLMCDPRDLGASVVCDLQDASTAGETAPGCLYIHEQYPGGVGIAKELYASFRAIAGDCLEAVRSCGCRSGCPSCVSPPEGKEDLRKKSSIILLRTIT